MQYRSTHPLGFALGVGVCACILHTKPRELVNNYYIHALPAEIVIDNLGALHYIKSKEGDQSIP